MGGLGEVQIPSPSVESHVWESCHDRLISKLFRGKLSTDNMTIVEKYWGECLVINYFIRIFVLVLWSFLGGKYKAGWSILAPLSVSHIM
jgi:hypothetical protein